MKRKRYLVFGILVAVLFDIVIEWEFVVFPHPWIKRLVSLIGLIVIVATTNYLANKNKQ
ncbi:hypothetical protein [Thermoactinomyces sp. DSM 45892]|uniref:hypothetical protein n=1 Tax=Thermoactinomyces sp. DSM 45892 TaxID=1882753 RepID=UPI00089CD325|nr:hypothetical protein [Thermoactinomyces sp. DSM 45892]SDY72306.1 hypothetical protein SAMN05444416_107177 [Thermoactinomyces sp. DSM 45892]